MTHCVPELELGDEKYLQFQWRPSGENPPCPPFAKGGTYGNASAKTDGGGNFSITEKRPFTE
jgi:hypothetical protein